MSKRYNITPFVTLQCLDSVGWAAGKASTHKNWVMRCWCGYLSGARCKWFAYGPADANATSSSSLTTLKSRMALPFRYWLTQVVMEKRPHSEQARLIGRKYTRQMTVQRMNHGCHPDGYFNPPICFSQTKIAYICGICYKMIYPLHGEDSQVIYSSSSEKPFDTTAEKIYSRRLISGTRNRDHQELTAIR